MVDLRRGLDARRLNATQFVVEEFDARGVHVAVAEEHARAEAPAVYTYAFASEEIAVPPVIDAVAVARLEKPYSAVRELRFGSLEASAIYSSYLGTTGTLGATFTDPLEFNDVRVAGSFSTWGSGRAAAQYTYSRYLPHVYARQSYADTSWRSLDGRRRVVDQESALGVNMKVWRHDRWDSSLDEALVFTQEGPRYDDEQSRTRFGVYSHAALGRQIRSPLGLYPWRLLKLDLTHRALDDSSSKRPVEQTGSVQLTWSHGFEGEFYLGGEAQYAASNQRALDVGFATDLMPTAIGVPRLTFAPQFPARAAGRARLEARQTLPALLYDTRIPLGLNRVGLVVTGQALGLSRTGPGRPKTILEYGYGVDAELLVAHSYPFATRILLTHVDHPTGDDAADQITFGLSSTF